MINLLPPSPVPSQIDTTFQRRERVEISQDRSQDSRNKTQESESIRKPDEEREVDDQKPDKSENKENTAPSDFEAFLKLIAASKPHKKNADLPATAETPKSTKTDDNDATLAVVTMAQLLSSEQNKTVSTPTATSASDLIPSASKAIDSSASSSAAAIEIVSTTTDPAASARLNASSKALATATSATQEATTASVDAELKSATESMGNRIDPTAVEPAPTEPTFEAISSTPIQVISQTSKTATETLEIKNAELTTAFDMSQVSAFSVSQSAPERDEITREIERLIAAASSRSESTPSLAATSIDVMEPVVSTSEIPDSALATVLPSDVVGEQPREQASVQLMSEPGYLGQQSQKDRSGISSTSAITDAEAAAPRTVSSANQNSSTTAWNGALGTSADFNTQTSSELREPLSSQTARAIVHHFETHKAEDNETLTVRLDPPELGELTIELSRTRDGLAVRVTAREAVTMDMLLARGNEIERHLKNQNVDVATMEFASSGMMNQQSSRQNGSRQTQEDLLVESSRRLSRTAVENTSNGRRDPGSTQDSSRALSFRA